MKKIYIFLFLFILSFSAFNFCNSDTQNEPDIPSSECSIKGFSFLKTFNNTVMLDREGEISANQIILTVPYNTDITSLIANFSISGVKIESNGIEQISGVTANDFSTDVKYTVIAEDNSISTYTVKVTVDDKQVSKSITGIAYGPHPKNKFDIYLPEDRYYHTPVIIFMHGGGWIKGNKSEFSDLCTLYQGKGYAAVTMNYRFTNDTTETVTYIEIMADIHSVIEYIVSRSAEWKISNKFALAGFSAGAVNAVLYPYGFDKENLVKACVAFSGAYDMNDDVIRQNCLNNMGHDIILMFAGTESNFTDASPINHLKNVPTLIFHGTNDSYMGPDHVNAFVDALRLNNIIHDYTLYPGAGHGGYFQPGASKHSEVVSKMDTWFETYLW